MSDWEVIGTEEDKGNSLQQTLYSCLLDLKQKAFQWSCQPRKHAVNAPPEWPQRRPLTLMQSCVCSAGTAGTRREVSGDPWVSQGTTPDVSQSQMPMQDTDKKPTSFCPRNTFANTHCSSCLGNNTGLFSCALAKTHQCLFGFPPCKTSGDTDGLNPDFSHTGVAGTLTVHFK